MRKISLSILAASMVFLFAVGIVPVQAEEMDTEAKATVQLTEEQKTEIGALHKEMFEKKKEIIAKYVEYGVLTEKKAKKIISKMEKRHQELEKNGYMWDCEHGKKEHKHKNR